MRPNKPRVVLPTGNSTADAFHVDGRVREAVGVASLIVVPLRQLHEVVVQGGAGADFDEGRRLERHEVSGRHLLVREVGDVFHTPRNKLLDRNDDVVVLGGFPIRGGPCTSTCL